MTVGARARGAVLAVAFAAALLGTSTTARADVTAQGCAARAVVVVEPGPGAVPICFSGAISGLDALQLAGANPLTYGFAGQGAAVCQLFGVGNPADSSCLIGPGGQYWAYYRAAPGAGGWTYSRGGASASTVVDGSVEGWRYGTGAAPGFVSFCAVVGCGPPPTEAPPPAPPVTSPPVVAGGTATPPAAGTTATTAAPSSAKAGTGGDGATDGQTATTGKDGTTSTTGKSGTVTGEHSSRRDSGTVELASGGDSGSDSGSPVGVIVAVAVVALGAGAGLWLRRRRRGSAPG